MNKGIYFFIILTAFFLISCSEKNKVNCSQYKTGKFLLKKTAGNHQFLITRDSTHQIELDQQTDTATGEQIVWTGDCEYELVKSYKMGNYSDTTNKNLRAESDMVVYPVKVKIIESTSKYYIFEASKDGIHFLYRDTLWVVK
jgi:hypothetical protein